MKLTCTCTLYMHANYIERKVERGKRGRERERERERERGGGREGGE